MKDFGYDVSNYRDVHPDFGDLATMDQLIAACHARGIRVLLDFVPNHTSDQHPWFLESRSSRDNPKRDWYIWRDLTPEGRLPNNWIAVFGEPAWTFSKPTGQYYLHLFLASQPDLNWRNPEVVSEMHDVLRFWMARGVDGFRIDVMGMILKHPDLPDNPRNPAWQPGMSEHHQQLSANSLNHPDVYDAVRELRVVLDEFGGSTAVGEVFGTPDEISRYYGTPDVPGLHLAFNFRLLVRGGILTPWDARDIAPIVIDSDAALPPGAQPCYALNNHDQPRFVSRHNIDGFGTERARAACLLLLGLRSTPFIYYGEEIGMVDVDIPPELQQDPSRFFHIGRDPQRTPMQWDATPGRGFSAGIPWLPYGPAEINVAAQQRDPTSLLSLYRQAIRVRKAEPSLHCGAFAPLSADEATFAFIRRAAEARPVVVAVNTAVSPADVRLPSEFRDVLVATHSDVMVTPDGELQLPPLGAAWVAG
jgi:alpha-glucosidase